MKRNLICIVFLITAWLPASAERLNPDIPWSPISDVQPVRVTCKQARSCEEAVIMWCNGYYGADRDRDGIPCETVCSSREQVEAIEAEIGCSL